MQAEVWTDLSLSVENDIFYLECCADDCFENAAKMSHQNVNNSPFVVGVMDAYAHVPALIRKTTMALMLIGLPLCASAKVSCQHDSCQGIFSTKVVMWGQVNFPTLEYPYLGIDNFCFRQVN